jgi:hypothetical protein
MGASPYRTLRTTRGIAWQAAAGSVAQLTQSAAGLGIILVTQHATGSLAIAGAAAAGFAIGAGIARPIQGRLIDHRGPATVLALSGALHTCALA